MTDKSTLVFMIFLISALSLSPLPMQQGDNQIKGVELDNVHCLEETLPQYGYSAPSQRSAFVQQVMNKVEALPGIDSVGAIDTLPNNESHQSKLISPKSQKEKI